MCYLSNNVDDVTRDLKMKITHENNIMGILEKENKCQLVVKITLSTRRKNNLEQGLFERRQ